VLFERDKATRIARVGQHISEPRFFVAYPTMSAMSFAHLLLPSNARACDYHSGAGQPQYGVVEADAAGLVERFVGRPRRPIDHGGRCSSGSALLMYAGSDVSPEGATPLARDQQLMIYRHAYFGNR
jgi:hypothetical protein